MSYLSRKVLALSNLLLKPIEERLAQRYGETGIRKYPPLFIIGCPRSGTTLLYKVLTERYKFSFFSNYTARFYKVPICGTYLQKSLGITVSKGNYNFNFGTTHGPGAPNESGEFWYRWFPGGLHVYVPPNITPQSVLKELRQEIGAISYITRSPMLFKNLYNSMRIAPILEAIPEARFIVCRRDNVENAISILKARIQSFNRKDAWWSVPPKEVDELLSKGHEEQVAGQVYHIYRQIKEDKKRFGEDKFLETRYEDFCRDVHGTLHKIEEFLRQSGCGLESRWDVPVSFEVRSVEGIDPKDRKKITSAIHSFFKDSRALK